MLFELKEIMKFLARSTQSSLYYHRYYIMNNSNSDNDKITMDLNIKAYFLL